MGQYDWLNPRPDNRKGDRHKGPRPGHHGPKKARWDQANVIAWDGEGWNLNTVDNRGIVTRIHVYNLLANSLGRSLATQQNAGLGTRECLDFFLASNPISAIHVIYAGGYDVNMILKDVPRHKIKALWKEGHIEWEGYRIVFRPRKMFSVAKADKTSKTGWGRSFVLWDVFGFYQSSFVKACQKWLVNIEELQAISDMKARRMTFSLDGLPEIAKYNQQECQLLVMLVKALMSALDEADLRLSRFDGAGAIAGAMLRKNNIKDHIVRPPDTIYRAIQMAYAGGRIEAPKVGNHEGHIWKYDINSAYPAAAVAVCPSWKDVKWQSETRPAHNEKGCVASLVAVEWSYSTDAPFYPLFYRDSHGTILFPRSGCGIYWHHEYELLCQHYVEGVDFTVLYAINAYGNAEYPLKWIEQAYEFRLWLKAQGNMAQEAIKLGINSIYGKFAQQEGYVKGIPGVRNERYPTYHCLAWASLITSRTRAVLYNAAYPVSEHVAAFATDAIISTAPIDGMRVGKGLGEWSLDEYDGLTLVQAGVYWLKNGDEWEAKYRGFDPGSLSRDKVITAWDTGQDNLPVTLTRFVGMGSALARTDFDGIWRSWHTETRHLDLTPKGKRTPLDKDYANRLCPTTAAHNFDEGLSSPYPVVWMDGRKHMRPTVDGVDVKEIEREMEDSIL